VHTNIKMLALFLKFFFPKKIQKIKIGERQGLGPLGVTGISMGGFVSHFNKSICTMI
jgi:hypothetical protein